MKRGGSPSSGDPPLFMSKIMILSSFTIINLLLHLTVEKRKIFEEFCNFIHNYIALEEKI
jgi:hypothetical protein